MTEIDINKAHANCKALQDKHEKCLGEWNGYVEKGKDKEERRSRLREVPEHISKAVQDHVETVWRIKKAAGKNLK